MRATFYVTGMAPFEFEFESGKTFQDVCMDVRADENHPLRVLYEQRRGIDWRNIYYNCEPRTFADLVSPLIDGDAFAVTPRITGCGGGKRGFVAEMTNRIRSDLANPFLTDEERARFEARNDERVWERFWDENEGNPPCTYPLDSVKPLEAPA